MLDKCSHASPQHTDRDLEWRPPHTELQLNVSTHGSVVYSCFVLPYVLVHSVEVQRLGNSSLRTGITMDVNRSNYKYKITVDINHSSYQCIVAVNINHSSYKYKIAVKYYINFTGCSIIYSYKLW